MVPIVLASWTTICLRASNREEAIPNVKRQDEGQQTEAWHPPPHRPGLPARPADVACAFRTSVRALQLRTPAAASLRRASIGISSIALTFASQTTAV